MNDNIQDLREDYRKGELIEQHVPSDPIALFTSWFKEAQAATIPEPNAMTIATVDADHKPSARVVLLKGYDHKGFVFYTNYDSRKGKDIAENPFVSCVFLWKEIERQVRIEGHAVKLPEDQSTRYYQSRPKGSQMGAWASPQSTIISDRSVLENNYDQVSKRYEDSENLPKPPNWGGYLIVPTVIEFWQGRSSRMHDRLQYTNIESEWQIDRLAP